MARRIVNPHSLRTGDRVYQRYSPQYQGTVTFSDSSGFGVTYDGHGRKRNEPRERYRYRPYQVEAFLIGTPSPDMFAVAVEEDS